MHDSDPDRREERATLIDALARREHSLSEEVLEVMRRVPRHRFVPASEQVLAYADDALPIGEGQTISQPAVVALMTSLLELRPDDVVLEIGTGSGYQTAILAALARHVYSVERIGALAETARKRLDALGVRNVTIRCGDGGEGWPEHGPYRAILVTAGAPSVPGPLLAQLVRGGRMVIPVDAPDGWGQELRLIERDANGRLAQRTIERVFFVPFLRGCDE